MPFTLDIDYNRTLGAVFIGFGLSCVIFGILSAQTFTYFQRFPKDVFAYKALVTTLWLLELFDQVLISCAAYTYIITRFDDLIAIISNKIAWSLLVQIVLGSFVGVIVKTCFAMRVWRFSGRNVFVTGAILMLIVTTFGLAVVYTVKSFALASILEIDNTKFYGTLALGTGVSTDVITASALCFFLHRLRTGHDNSDSLVNTLTVYAVNSGALTSAISLTTLLLYNLQANAFYFMASFFCLGKVYAISLLCTLNTRQAIRGRGTDRGGNTYDGACQRSAAFAINHHSQSNHELQTKSVQIDVRQEISVVTDGGSSNGYKVVA
ncbi:hypothetical protein AX15_005890 [Amanita polypyramis BW_CC]|nr:hypothetical protein AX15_005890 [Amanita polypyramis BW_CC]